MSVSGCDENYLSIRYENLKIIFIKSLKDCSYTLGNLKNLCCNYIPECKRNRITSVGKLVDGLQEEGALGADNVKIVKVLAEELELGDLKEKVETYEWKYSLGYSGKASKVVSEAPEKCWGAFKGGTKEAVIVLKTFFNATAKVAAISTAAIVGSVVTYYANSPETFQNLFRDILPYAMNLVGLKKGSLYFMLETSSLSSLKQLWKSYKNGSLEEKFKKVINEIDEVRKLTQGTEIDMTVEIDEEEYREACWQLVLAENQEVQAYSGSMEKRRRHSFSCDQYLTCSTKTQLTLAEWMRMKELEKELELENREAKEQLANLEQEVSEIKKEEMRLRERNTRKVAELKFVKKVNEELKAQCSKALSLLKSVQMLKIVKDACLNFTNLHQVVSTNIEDMEQGDEDAKKVVFDSIQEYHMAIKYFEACLDPVLEESQAAEISIYGNLGKVFCSLSNYSKAKECYEKVLEIAENSGNKREQMKAHRNLGILHRKLHKDTPMRILGKRVILWKSTMKL